MIEAENNYQLFRKLEEKSGDFIRKANEMPVFDSNVDLYVAKVRIDDQVADSDYSFYVESFSKENLTGKLIAVSRRSELNGNVKGYHFVSNENGFIVASTIDEEKKLIIAKAGPIITSLSRIIDQEIHFI
jgi:hypothetical protein